MRDSLGSRLIASLGRIVPDQKTREPCRSREQKEGLEERGGKSEERPLTWRSALPSGAASLNGLSAFSSSQSYKVVLFIYPNIHKLCVMVHLMCPFDWVTGCPEIWSNIILGGSVSACLRKINI